MLQVMETFLIRNPMRFSSPLSRMATLAIGLSVACGGADRPAADSTAAAASTPAADTSHAGMSGMSGVSGMSGMAMTGNADHDFLRMMSDHHKGLIAMAHMTIEGKQAGTVMELARRMDAKQDVELDSMTTMLERDFRDSYAPKVVPEHQAMVDDLKARSGADYDRTFLRHVILHHEEAVKMIEQYLPTAKSPQLKAMAEKMKADQTNEIADLKQRLAKLG